MAEKINQIQSVDELLEVGVALQNLQLSDSILWLNFGRRLEQWLAESENNPSGELLLLTSSLLGYKPFGFIFPADMRILESSQNYLSPIDRFAYLVVI